MTRTVLGPSGEQQRVTVERDFKNEADLNVFLKQFGENMSKPTMTKAKKSSTQNNESSTKSQTTTEDFTKSPGYARLNLMGLG